MRACLIGFVLLLITAAGVCWLLLNLTPAEYVRFEAFLESRSIEQIEQMALAVEEKFANAIKQTPSGARVLSLGRDEVNAWLTNRLAHQVLRLDGRGLPPAIGDIMVSTTGDDFVVHLKLTTTEFTRVITLVGDVDFSQRGQATIRLKAIRAGRLPLPMAVLTGVLKKNAPIDESEELVQDAADLLDGNVIDTTFAYDATRQVTVVDIDIDHERLTMKLDVQRSSTGPSTP